MKTIRLSLSNYIDGEHIYATLVGFPDGRVDVGRFGLWVQATHAAISHFTNRCTSERDMLRYYGRDDEWETHVLKDYSGNVLATVA